jgi:molybdopterin biosynthesis enzyme
MDKKYEVTVAVEFNGHKITRTYEVYAQDEEMAKELAEAMTDVDILISSGTPRELGGK